MAAVKTTSPIPVDVSKGGAVNCATKVFLGGEREGGFGGFLMKRFLSYRSFVEKVMAVGFAGVVV